jgi:hypothetical protein
LNGVHESIKILYEAGKDIERGQSIAEHMMTRRRQLDPLIAL